MYQLVIPTFNNPSYLERFISQLDNYQFSRIEIFDNNSDYLPMIELLEQLKNKENINVRKFDGNYGPHYALRNPEIYSSLDDIFCLSDPDIQFSETLPKDFLNIMHQISEKYKIGKVGFAIEIPKKSELSTPYVFMDGKLQNIEEWEQQFWSNLVGRTIDGDPIFETTLDTTFALYNKKYFDPNDRYRALRIAGNFTSKHLGFYHERYVDKAELDIYKNKSRYSYFSGTYDSEGNPVVQLSVLEYTTIIEKLESLERECIKLAQERDNLNLAIKNLYKSQSWILTKPLRTIMRFFDKGEKNE